MGKRKYGGAKGANHKSTASMEDMISSFTDLISTGKEIKGQMKKGSSSAGAGAGAAEAGAGAAEAGVGAAEAGVALEGAGVLAAGSEILLGILVAIIVAILVVVFAGWALNSYIASEYDHLKRVWINDTTLAPNWRWYNFWRGVMSLPFLDWFWTLWFGPKTSTLTGSAMRYKCDNGQGVLCGEDPICNNSATSPDRFWDALGKKTGWWDPAPPTPETYKCEPDECNPGYSLSTDNNMKCEPNTCTCEASVSNKGSYQWTTGQTIEQIGTAENDFSEHSVCQSVPGLESSAKGCIRGTCKDHLDRGDPEGSFYDRGNCFANMECGCPSTEVGGNIIKNIAGINEDCIRTNEHNIPLPPVENPICVHISDGNTLEATDEQDCTGKGGKYYEYTGCSGCGQGGVMDAAHELSCTGTTPTRTTDCSDIGPNCKYINNPAVGQICTISQSPNTFSINSATSMCEIKRCTCEIPGESYMEQRGVPNQGDSCPGAGVNSCQSCYDGYVNDPAHSGENQCSRPATEQGEGDFCWPEQGILCSDTYFCGSPRTLNFSEHEKGMCLPRHIGTSAGDTEDFNAEECNMAANNRPYIPGWGYNQDGTVGRGYTNLSSYLTGHLGCAGVERIALSETGLPRTLMNNDSTCTDGRECASGICGDVGACFQGPIGSETGGSCCNTTWESGSGGADHMDGADDAAGTANFKYYGRSEGNVDDWRAGRNRINENIWWKAHGQRVSDVLNA